MTAQNMGKKILTDAGYDVIAVSNGAAAAKKILEQPPDIAILDVHMPGYTGFEVCAKIRAAHETAKMPVLLTVGKMEPYSPQDGARVKADGVIVKPFEASDLTAAVERLSQKLKPAQPEILPPAMKTPPPHPAEFKDESYLAWKQEAPTHAEETDERSSPKAPAGEYQHTMRLDPAQIAAMLKVGPSKGESSSPEPTPATEEFNVAAPAHSAEEFAVAPAPEPEPATANIPAFGVDVAEPATTAEVPSYMAHYLASEPAESVETVSATAETVAIRLPDFKAAVEPAFEPVASAASASAADDMAETVVIPRDALLQHLTPPAVPAPPVAAAEGLELTAAPAHDAPVGQESGLEPTLQTSEAPTMIMKDPALVTDPHRSTMDFVTQFGAGEPGLSEELLRSMGSATGEQGKPVTVDDFDARVNAAMTSFAEPSADLSTLLQAASSPGPEAEVVPASPSFEIPAAAEENAFIAGSSNETSTLPTVNEPEIDADGFE